MLLDLGRKLQLINVRVSNMDRREFLSSTLVPLATTSMNATPAAALPPSAASLACASGFL